MRELDKRLTALSRHLVELRRAFHAHPELAFHEVETAGRITAELERLGIDFDYQGQGHAVIAHIEPPGTAGLPAVALRAEMDALPGQETTGAVYASRYADRMHACGHGAHMAMVCGAAALLVGEPPPGRVRLIFQPAEERGGGARTAIQDGALDDVSAIFGGHVTHEYVTGQIMIRDGDITAQSDRFFINIHGKGGHGARPHEAIDAVVIAGFLITALQTLVSREVNPLHPSVVTVGRVQAGSAPNVIAETAVLEGSIRTTREEMRRHIHHGLRRMCAGIAELHNAAIDVRIQEGYPPVVNSPREVAIARRAAAALVGQEAVVAAEFPSMGSEDFSYYLQKVPGCFVRFGARRPEWEPVPLHSPGFDIDEAVLAVGAGYFAEVARAALQEYGQAWNSGAAQHTA